MHIATARNGKQCAFTWKAAIKPLKKRLPLMNEKESNAMNQAAVWVMIAAVAKISDMNIVCEEE